MQLAFISHESFYQGPSGQWYATAAFPSDFIAGGLPEMTRFTIWVRKKVLAAGEEGRLFSVPVPPGVEFEVVGPENERSGPIGYIWSLVRNLPSLWRLARNNEVLWCKLPSVFPAFVFKFARKDCIRCVQVIGNVRESVRILYPRLGWFAGWIDRCTRAAVQKANIAAFVSKALYLDYGLQCRKSLVFHLGMLRPEQLYLDRPALHKPFRLLYVGRISKEKGLNFVIQALAKLPTVELRIAGAGPFAADCRLLAESLNVADRIVWLGHLRWGKDLFHQYREADALIVPSLTEGLPQVAVEAQCHSLPVVASEVGGLPEIISSGDNGILFSPGDSDAIVAAVSEVAQESVWQRLVEGARRGAASHTIEKQMGRFLAEIRQIWQEKRHRNIGSDLTI